MLCDGYHCHHLLRDRGFCKHKIHNVIVLITVVNLSFNVTIHVTGRNYLSHTYALHVPSSKKDAATAVGPRVALTAGQIGSDRGTKNTARQRLGREVNKEKNK